MKEILRRLRPLLVVWLVTLGSRLAAQECLYEQMAGAMNEKSLPLVNLTVDTATVCRDSFVVGEIEIADRLERTVPGEDRVKFCCLLRYRGASAAQYDKKSFAVKLTSEEGAELKANVLGIREENSWILDAMAIDRLRMRNRVCFDVWNEMSYTPYNTKHHNRNGTKGVFVEVFLNGDYHGLYCLTDKIDRQLLGLKESSATKVRGLLYKGVSWTSGHNLRGYEEAATDTTTWNAWELQYPSEYPSEEAWQPLKDLIDFCDDMTPDRLFANEYEKYFYTDNWVDYVVFTLAMNVGDNLYKNTFLSVPDIGKEHRFLVTPWDMDMSLGGSWNGDYDPSLASIDRYGGVAPLNRLTGFDIDGFCEKVAARWNQWDATLLSPLSVEDRIVRYARLFDTSGAWAREVEKWDGNPVALKADVMDEVEYVVQWYRRNYASLCEQFVTGVPLAIKPPSASSCLGGGLCPSPQEGRSGGVSTLHNLLGQKVNNSAKGLVITGGKKLLKR